MKLSHNILVVDDDKNHTLLISELLRRPVTLLPQCTTFSKRLPLRIRRPDVVVLDLHMPLMGGIDIVERS